MTICRTLIHYGCMIFIGWSNTCLIKAGEDRLYGLMRPDVAEDMCSPNLEKEPRKAWS